MKLYKIEELETLSMLPSEFEREVWKREVAEYMRRKAQLKTNVRSAYTLVWGQCNLNLQNKLRSLPDFKTFDDKYDVLELLKSVKSCTYQIEQQKDPVLALVNALKKLFLTFQARGATIESHYERFVGMMEVVEGYGGSFPVHNKLINEELEYYDESERNETSNVLAATEASRNRMMGMLFLLSVDRSRYGSLLTELETDKVKGFDNYPKTLDEAYGMIISYSGIRKFEQRRETPEDVSFLCKEQTFDKSNIECYNCHKMGHFANECPSKEKKTKTGTAIVTFGNEQRIDDDDIHLGTMFVQIKEDGERSLSKRDNRQDETIGRERDTNDEEISDDPSEMSGWSSYEFSSSDDSGDSFDKTTEGNENIPEEVMQRLYIPAKYAGRRVFTWGPWYIIRRRNGKAISVGPIDIIAQEIEEEKARTNGSNSENNVSLTQHERKAIDPNWIPLDSQSTIDLFNNRDLLVNIRKGKCKMTVRGTGGTESADLIGTLSGYREVWFKEGGIANILSLSRVTKLYRVTYDSDKGNCFKMERNGHSMYFCQSEEGLFYFDARHDEYSLVHTVEENKKKYTARRIDQANLARRTYAMIGRPSMKDFENIIKLNLLPNCPVTVDDIKVANKIYGAEIAALQGKTVRRKPDRVLTDQVMVPPELVHIHKDVVLAIDVIFVNKIGFFVTVSRNIKFITVQYVTNWKATTLLEGIKAIYATAGFKVTQILADGEFDHLKIRCLELGVRLNTTSANEHVSDVERTIRVIKERARAMRSSLPFKKLPKRIIIEMIVFCVFWLNQIPNKNGISDTLSPRAIVTGSQIDFRTHCRILFGAYAQTHEENEMRNNISIPRTQGGICLGPVGNRQGGYKFLSLQTGKKVTRRAFTEIPMSESVIQAVHLLADIFFALQRIFILLVESYLISVRGNNSPTYPFIEGEGCIS